MITVQTETLDESTIGRMSQRQKLWVYNGLDCCLTLEIFKKIRDQLDETSAKTYAFSLDLQAAFLEMSLRGVAIDFEERRRLVAEYEDMTKQLERQLDLILAEGVGTKLNWRSPKQLGQLFYDVIGLAEKRKRGADGQMSRTTNRDALEKLRGYLLAEPIVNHILLLRDIEKKLQFLEMGIDSDGRIRTSYNPAGTNTGRPSSSTNEFGTGGNLQNVERKLRRIIVADKGMKFCNVDLEQADSRNVGARCWNIFYKSHGAAFAGAYLDACESGDLHTAVTRMCWGELPWPESPAGWRKIADEIAYREFSYRDLAKKLGHGSNYMGTPPTMAMHTKMPQQVIKDFQRKYLGEAFPCIPEWHKWVQRQLEREHQLTTFLDRRRYFFGNPRDAATLREAVAYEPQSLTADEIDTALLRVRQHPHVQPLLQVHDSLLFQYPEEMEDEIVPWALETMKVQIDIGHGREFYVPVEAKIGWNWADADAVNEDGLKKWKGHDTRTRTIPAPSDKSPWE